MAPSKPANAADSFVTRLTAFYAGVFIALGIQMPFLPVWLAAKGLDADAIGTVLAAPLLLRIVAVPLVTGLADRLGAFRGLLMATAALTAAGYSVLGLASGFPAILAMVALGSAAFTSVFPLSDAYALKGLAARGHPYGAVRLWGSAAFIVGSLGAGLLADEVQPVSLIWLMAGGFIAMAFTSLALEPLETTAPVQAQPGSSLAFVRSRDFLLVATAAALIQASHAVFYGFSALDWTKAGLSGHAVGALWAIGVLAEIGMFALSGRLPPAIGPGLLLCMGAAGAVVRWGVMAFDPPALVQVPVQCLHGLSFAATHLGAVQFLARAAPPGLGATTQGYLAIVLGVVMAAFMRAAGVLYGTYGVRAYGVMAVAALIGGMFAFAAHRLRPDDGA
jgi:PPP family 3-phenylpropionic acid transporter